MLRTATSVCCVNSRNRSTQVSLIHGTDSPPGKVVQLLCKPSLSGETFKHAFLEMHITAWCLAWMPDSHQQHQTQKKLKKTRQSLSRSMARIGCWFSVLVGSSNDLSGSASGIPSSTAYLAYLSNFQGTQKTATANSTETNTIDTLTAIKIDTKQTTEECDDDCNPNYL